MRICTILTAVIGESWISAALDLPASAAADAAELSKTSSEMLHTEFTDLFQDSRPVFHVLQSLAGHWMLYLDHLHTSQHNHLQAARQYTK